MIQPLIATRFAVVAKLALALAAQGPSAHAMQQDIALGTRVGTLGIGADVAVSLHENVAIRGGAGFLGFDVDLTGMFGLAANRTAELSLPTALYTVGAEASSGPFRAGAGLLFRSADPIHEITYESGATIDIGGGFYQHPEILTLTTTLISGSTAPYALIGMTSRLKRGFEFVVDLGAVLHLNPKFDMTATGDPTVLNSPRFRADLDNERWLAENDAGSFVKFWPIISLGVRRGLR